MSNGKEGAAVLGCLAIILIIIGSFAVTFLAIAGLSFLVCLGFGLAWSWYLALGIFAAVVLASVIYQFIFK